MVKNRIQQIDALTGEIISDTIVNCKKVNSVDEFMQVYLSDLSGLMNLTLGELKVLFVLWKFSIFYDSDTNDAGNLVVANKDMYERICEISGVEEQTARNNVSSLAKKGILIKKKNRGSYYLNPKYFFKGRLGDKTKALQVYMNYQIGD